MPWKMQEISHFLQIWFLLTNLEKTIRSRCKDQRSYHCGWNRWTRNYRSMTEDLQLGMADEQGFGRLSSLMSQLQIEAPAVERTPISVSDVATNIINEYFTQRVMLRICSV